MSGIEEWNLLEFLKGVREEGEYGYATKEEAHSLLMEMSGEQFAIDDWESWTAWVELATEKLPSTNQAKRKYD